MRGIAAALCACAVCACASIHDNPEQAWRQATAKIHGDAAAGKISPLQEEEQLRDAFLHFNGPEPDVMGYYAYAISLMQSAQDGAMTQKMANALIQAREKEVLAREAALEKRRQFEGCAWNACSGP